MSRAKGSPPTVDEEVSLTFPQRLMEVLDDESNHHIAAWVDNGRAFMIFDKEAFLEEILPRYFRQRQPKFLSFVRKLNRWGFTRIPAPPLSATTPEQARECPAYIHPLFQRGQHRLLARMGCGQEVSKTYAAQEKQKLMQQKKKAAPPPATAAASSAGFVAPPPPQHHLAAAAAATAAAVAAAAVVAQQRGIGTWVSSDTAPAPGGRQEAASSSSPCPMLLPRTEAASLAAAAVLGGTSISSNSPDDAALGVLDSSSNNTIAARHQHAPSVLAPPPREQQLQQEQASTASAMMLPLLHQRHLSHLLLLQQEQESVAIQSAEQRRRFEIVQLALLRQQQDAEVARQLLLWGATGTAGVATQPTTTELPFPASGLARSQGYEGSQQPRPTNAMDHPSPAMLLASFLPSSSLGLSATSTVTSLIPPPPPSAFPLALLGQNGAGITTNDSATTIPGGSVDHSNHTRPPLLGADAAATTMAVGLQGTTMASVAQGSSSGTSVLPYYAQPTTTDSRMDSDLILELLLARQNARRAERLSIDAARGAPQLLQQQQQQEHKHQEDEESSSTLSSSSAR